MWENYTQFQGKFPIKRVKNLPWEFSPGNFSGKFPSFFSMRDSISPACLSASLFLNLFFYDSLMLVFSFSLSSQYYLTIKNYLRYVFLLVIFCPTLNYFTFDMGFTMNFVFTKFSTFAVAFSKFCTFYKLSIFPIQYS